jgi:SAM-dependent methyltransferase
MNSIETAGSSPYLDAWANGILAHPVSKLPVRSNDLPQVDGVVDARVYLKNTFGYSEWEEGQNAYEGWEASSDGYKNKVAAYLAEIEYDAPTYERFKLTGSVLDVGGGLGTVREFLPADAKFISVDPFISAPFRIPEAKAEAYKCLSRKLNFIAGMAEFIPFQSEVFDWVHMRSMLDHVQVPDLALLEAARVLKSGGKLLVGLTVEGGKSGRRSVVEVSKDVVKHGLPLIGITKHRDFHTWHPTFPNLLKIIEDNGFFVEDSYWQPYWNGKVVYICAGKP